MFRRSQCQFIPDINGKYPSGEIKDGKIEIRYGNTWRRYWLLPDGSASIISIEPKEKYDFGNGRYFPSDNGKFTVAGTFPFFRINETGHWVWLNADHSLTFAPVNFIEQANEWQRLAQMVERDYVKPARTRRITPRKSKIVLTSKIVVESESSVRWAVYGNGDELDFGWTVDKVEARFAVAQSKSKLTASVNRIKYEP